MRLTYDYQWSHPCRRLARHFAVQLSRNAGKRTYLDIGSVSAATRMPAQKCIALIQGELNAVRDLTYHASGYRVKLKLEGERVFLKGW